MTVGKENVYIYRLLLENGIHLNLGINMGNLTKK